MKGRVFSLSPRPTTAAQVADDTSRAQHHLADLTYVRLRLRGAVCQARHMLDAGVATWQDLLWSLEPTWTRAALPGRCSRWRRPGPGTPGQAERRAVSAQRGPAHLQQPARWPTFVDAAGKTHWDHIFVTQLFSNASHRPP